MTYKCSICSKPFSTNILLERHIRTNHKTSCSVAYRCPYCGHPFQRLMDHDLHIDLKHYQQHMEVLNAPL